MGFCISSGGSSKPDALGQPYRLYINIMFSDAPYVMYVGNTCLGLPTAMVANCSYRGAQFVHK